MTPKLYPPPPRTPLGVRVQKCSRFFIHISLEPQTLVTIQKKGFNKKKGFSGHAEYFYILSEKIDIFDALLDPLNYALFKNPLIK